MSKMRILLLAPLAVLIGVRVLPAQSVPSSDRGLMGTVKSSDGKPLEGVAVSARAEGKTFTTTVFTDQKGEYYFPPLDPGQYNVWAQAVGFQAGKSNIELSGARKARQDLTLRTLKDFGAQLSGIEWMASLPENTPQDRRTKAILSSTCTGCHSAETWAALRFDNRGWGVIFDYMENRTGIPGGGAIWTPETYKPGPFVRAYKEELGVYLGRVLGPKSDPVNLKPLPRPSGQETQVVITEYDVPLIDKPDYAVSHEGMSDWSLGAPAGYGGQAAHDVVVDKEGYVWFTDNDTPGRTLGKLDPRTGRITYYTITGANNAALGVHGIDLDPMGNVWLTNTEEMSTLKFDPRAEKFQRFPKPDSLPAGGGRTLEVDSKGNPWTSAAGGAMKLDPKTGQYTFYKSITNATPGASGSYYGLTVDGEDNVWFSMITKDRVGVVDSRTGKVGEVYLGQEEFEGMNDRDRQLVSSVESLSSVGPPSQKGPRKLRADRRGNSVWVPEYFTGKLAKIDIRTRKVTEYPMPHRYSKPYALAVDKNHMVWAGGINMDRVYKFDPFTEKWTVYRVPAVGVDLRHMAADDSTNPPTIWTTYFKTNKIVRLQFRTASATQSAAK